jgi:hypothetical protein
MLKILALDPSGTGTTGICLINQQITFREFKSKDWKEHLDHIRDLIQTYQPTLLLYENTHYIHQKTQDSLSLFRLLGALECLPLPKDSILVHQVKDLKKQLFKGIKQIPNLTFKPGLGWIFNQQKISLHQLDAFLVYWLWKEKHA